jgi:hypothetical protein
MNNSIFASTIGLNEMMRLAVDLSGRFVAIEVHSALAEMVERAGVATQPLRRRCDVAPAAAQRPRRLQGARLQEQFRHRIEATTVHALGVLNGQRTDLFALALHPSGPPSWIPLMPSSCATKPP